MNLITQYDCVDSAGAPAACEGVDAGVCFFSKNKRRPKLGHSYIVWRKYVLAIDVVIANGTWSDYLGGGSCCEVPPLASPQADRVLVADSVHPSWLQTDLHLYLDYVYDSCLSIEMSQR